uniref:Uncharacterized protein n=1 Tax=viral metagenome TaxID=1070528 RepID=A0A6C0J4D1_9ZZZZ
MGEIKYEDYMQPITTSFGGLPYGRTFDRPKEWVLYTVPIGSLWKMNEYDGSEGVEVFDQDNWDKA